MDLATTPQNTSKKLQTIPTKAEVSRGSELERATELKDSTITNHGITPKHVSSPV